METAPISPLDPNRSRRRSHEEEQSRKKAKTDAHTFTDAGSLVKLFNEADPDSSSFSIHKEVACSRSPVLRAAFCGSFAEAETQEYCLGDVTHGTVRFLTQWMYTGNLVIARLKDDWTNDGSKDYSISIQEDNDLFDLWVLADFLQMPELQNRVIEALYQASEKEHCMFNASYAEVYAQTATDSKLREFVCHHLIMVGRWANYREISEQLPHAMLIDIICLVEEGKRSFGDDMDLHDYFVV